ncbi:Crp/Fnr family transcriptional regulator [Flammeovirga sp. EKP202]|uniref:Crp/Fnr family transcriptional regulator n=1 Tax=Flammeovirga sp. EKP202 TaxID=2770592 RepID=UPI00165F11BF|nr:Crp/Fnr family transcriptional regulator [Flammeovirga sp. EKP202]MBD0404983.1 Crp/Fnr family transcriptional regulator [Flammeovirga sp. EKP202]
MTSELLSLLNQFVCLSSEEEKIITSSFKSITLAKGDFFLKEGAICKYVGFIKRGLVRYFVFKNEEESTFEFTKEGEFISDYTSFNRQVVSVQNIEAIEDCELLVIDREKLHYIFENTASGNLLARQIIEHRFDIMVNQLLAVYMQNSEQRYQKFMNEYGDLTQRIPQYLIASFVGVQPPSLSRIRKRLMK